jgi:hypothetical protein
MVFVELSADCGDAKNVTFKVGFSRRPLGILYFSH